MVSEGSGVTRAVLPSKCSTLSGRPYTSFSARSAGRARLWSPPNVISLGFGTSGETARRWPSSVKAAVICARATALSMGVMGMSPQSMILAQLWYGLMPARGLKPLKDVCLAEAWRIARGPKRAPGSSTT